MKLLATTHETENASIQKAAKKTREIEREVEIEGKTEGEARHVFIQRIGSNSK